MERNIPGMAVERRFRVATAEVKTAQKRVMGFFFDPSRACVRVEGDESNKRGAIIKTFD